MTTLWRLFAEEARCLDCDAPGEYRVTFHRCAMCPPAECGGHWWCHACARLDGGVGF